MEKHLTFNIHHSLFIIRYSLFSPQLEIDFYWTREDTIWLNGYKL